MLPAICGPGPPGGVRSSCSPCANEHWSPRPQSPVVMKRWHSFVLYIGKCAPDCNTSQCSTLGTAPNLAQHQLLMRALGV